MNIPSVLFVGRRASDRAFFRQVVAHVGAIPVLSVRGALESLCEGALSAMVIGDDVDDASALRLISLVRQAQPTLPVIFLWSEERATGVAVRQAATTVVERRLLAAAIGGVLNHQEPAVETPQRAELADDILLVDDDTLILRMMSRALRDLGYRTSTAPSPADAVALLRTKQFKMLVFDVEMPEQNGIDLMRSLRNGELGSANQETPVVFMTADNRPSTFGDIFDVGALHCLIKPVDGDRFGAIVAGLLHEAA